MIADLKPYLAMKNSGEPWLGEVPEHWDIQRLKATVNNVIQTAGREHADLYVALEHVESWTGRLRDAPSDFAFDSQVKRFSAGDVLFGKLRPYLAKVARPSADGVCVGEFLVLRPRSRRATAPYLEQLLRSKPFIDTVNSSTFGSKMPRADWQFIAGTAVPLPPLPEQAAIVRFLDHADRRIRRYIRAKQKLIKLLEEQKQAIIHRAVTRGFDPDVRLKPSGVEWLGDVPEHWEVKRCRYLFREIDRRSADGSEQHLSMSQRLGLVPSQLVDNRALVSESYAGGKLCEVGDLVLNRLKAHLGVFALAEQAGVISPDYTVLRPTEPAGAAYFERVLRSPACRGELKIRAKGIVEGFWRLYTDDFYDIRLPVPPLQERREIIDYNHVAVTEIDRGAKAAEHELSLLREYRTRLIADVVTGKLDVREAAARLPDELEQPEPLDEVEAEADLEKGAADDGDEGTEEAEA